MRIGRRAMYENFGRCSSTPTLYQLMADPMVTEFSL